MRSARRDRRISAGFTLCFAALMLALLLVPSGEFVPRLPFELIYAAAAFFGVGLVLILLGRARRT